MNSSSNCTHTWYISLLLNEPRVRCQSNLFLSHRMARTNVTSVSISTTLTILIKYTKETIQLVPRNRTGMVNHFVARKLFMNKSDFMNKIQLVYFDSNNDNNSYGGGWVTSCAAICPTLYCFVMSESIVLLTHSVLTLYFTNHHADCTMPHRDAVRPSSTFQSSQPFLTFH